MKKLLDLLNEIEEAEKTHLEPVKEEKAPVVDEIGKFFVTEKPKSKEDKIEDLVFESTVLYFANQVRGGLKEENVLGIYKQKSDARRAATEAIQQYVASIDEMESAMNDFRSAKKDIEEKKKVAKEKIMKLK